MEILITLGGFIALFIAITGLRGRHRTNSQLPCARWKLGAWTPPAPPAPQPRRLTPAERSNRSRSEPAPPPPEPVVSEPAARAGARQSRAGGSALRLRARAGSRARSHPTAPRRRAAAPSRATMPISSAASARNGWSGSAASHSRSAGFSSSAIRSKPDCSVRAGASLSARSWRFVLIALGELARRREITAGITQLNTAHIPSILTAAGTTVAYADVYAAYALYDFLSPGFAFILLGIVALATLAAALIHGPWPCRSRPGRRLCDAGARLERAAELLGALRLSRRRHRRRLCARPGAAVALACDHRRRSSRCSGCWSASRCRAR